MSRVGKNPIILEKGVEVSLSPSHVVTVKGNDKTLQIPMSSLIELKQEEGKVLLSRKNESAQAKSLHGLFRSLIYNATVGVSKGWNKDLEMNGVGYRASLSGKTLELNLGYSHPVKYELPDGIEVKILKQNRISVNGADKELVGRVANKIRNFRPPEPYLGKGVKYVDEVIRRKTGKSGGEKSK